MQERVSIWSLIATRQFVLLYIMNTLSIFTGIFAINNSKGYGQLVGFKDEEYLALLGSLASIFNALRFFWSSATDYLPYKVVYGFMLVLQVCFDFTTPLAA